jgi:hypothetical protein
MAVAVNRTLLFIFMRHLHTYYSRAGAGVAGMGIHHGGEPLG